MKKQNNQISNISLMLMGVVAILVLFNQFQISKLTNSGNLVTGGASASINLKANADINEIINKVVPRGTPQQYGQELGVSFDDPVRSLSILAALDRKIPTNSLTGQEKERFINVGTKISCEFCCSAPSVIDSGGRDLCGCSHAQSFRGLDKYLIKNHPEWTDDQILMELTKWKALYYPKNMVEKAVAANQNGLELTPAVLNDRNLLTKVKNKDLSSIGDLPEMVGGC